MPEAFILDGVRTPIGNSSSLNDGAAAVVVVSVRFVARQGLAPRARLVAGASVGVAPEIMGMGRGTALLLERP
jgi:acetyl-CoA acyltransferase